MADRQTDDFKLGNKAADMWLYTADACANEKVIPKKYRYTTGTALMNGAEAICSCIEGANLIDLRERPAERLAMQREALCECKKLERKILRMAESKQYPGVSGWQTEGKAFSYFSDNAKRIAYLDETATAVYWGLRSPYSYADNAYFINTGGSVNGDFVYNADFAPRPAFNLKSSIVVSDSTDSDGCYTVESVPGNDGGLYVKNNGLWVRAV